MGRKLNKQAENAEQGSSFFSRLSQDLSFAFSGMEGFSVTNLRYILRWYRYYQIQPQLGAELQKLDNKKVNNGADAIHEELLLIPWGHQKVIISKVKDPNQAKFYIEQTVKNGWSRLVLQIQIESDLYNRLCKTANNFELTLPKADSDPASCAKIFTI